MALELGSNDGLLAGGFGRIPAATFACSKGAVFLGITGANNNVVSFRDRGDARSALIPSLTRLHVKLLASLTLDRHLAYVGMTRHREELAIYYGRRSFENAGGLVSVLSRANAKEWTLDYTDRSLYRHALRIAEVRALHLMAVARALVRDRLEWTVRQKQPLSDLVQRLMTIGQRFRFTTAVAQMKQSGAGGVEVPMLAGIKTRGPWHQIGSRSYGWYRSPL